jgi:hypothetical protein
MKTFIVTTENKIAVAPPSPGASDQPSAAGESFTTHAELAALAEKWPSSRLVAIWNALPGVAAVKKFTDRKTAVRRIWEAVQLLEGNTAAEEPTVAPKRRTPGKPRGGKEKAATGRENSKSSQVIALLKRAKGATLAEIMEMTRWQAHSVRGFISAGLGKRMGLTVESSRRDDGARVYKIKS